MEKVDIKDLILATEGRSIFDINTNFEISSISTDTRTLKTGDLFFALKGQNYDGHNFIREAIDKGAKGIVVSRVDCSQLKDYCSKLPATIVVYDTLSALGNFAKYYRELFFPTVIAITGSNGKTTTKQMIYNVFKEVHPTLTSISNYNNLIGVPLTLFNLNSVHKYAILEFGISLSGEIDRLVEISQPDTGIITNIGNTHLEFLKDTQIVFNEKKKLLASLKQNQTGIINMDDQYLKKLIDEKEIKCNLITYSTKDETADVFANNIKVENNSIEFDIKSKMFKISGKIKLNMLGEYNVYNALAAITVSLYSNIEINIIKNVLNNFAPLKMHMEQILLPTGTIIINDAYNANFDSMKLSLNSFVNLHDNFRKIAVIGDMLELGDRSKEQHQQLGNFLTELKLDKIYLYGQEIKFAKDFIDRIETKYFDDSQELTKELLKELKENTKIFFKASRGIRFEKIIENLKVQN